MGLEMYVCIAEMLPATPVDFEMPGWNPLFHWDMHPDLHGWMERLYREKGGLKKNVNAINLLLTAEDIERLAMDIERYNLPVTSLACFGTSEEVDRQPDFAFIAQAREALAGGAILYYVSTT